MLRIGPQFGDGPQFSDTPYARVHSALSPLFESAIRLLTPPRLPLVAVF